MSDPLSRATEALKEQHADAPAPPPGMRERVLERADLGKRERRVSRAILVPLAAAFILLATWAAASGALMRSLSSSGTTEPSPAVSVTAPSAVPSPAVGRPALSAAPEAEAALAPALVSAPPSADSAVLTPPPAVVEPSRAPSVASAPPAPVAAELATIGERGSAPVLAASAQPSDGLYATAHHAHFEAHDPARALAAWDEYLADAPQGRFAPEARYNRALCLVRLGRTNEATVALRPFAQGAYGTYRREEATKLLSAMGDPATP